MGLEKQNYNSILFFFVVAHKLAPLKTHYFIRICYARYADDLLLGIVGAIELLSRF